MKDKPIFYYHSLSLFSVFILSCGIITLPFKSGDNFNLLAYLLCGIISVLVYLIEIPFCNFILSKNKKTTIILNIFTIILLLAVSVYSLFTLSDTFKEFSHFAKTILLPEYSLWISVVLFAIVCLIFSTRRQEDILKFALLTFILSFIIILFFFLLNLTKYEIKNIIIHRLPDFKELYNQSIPYFKKILFPILILPVYQIFAFNNSSKNTSVLGIIIGFLLLSLCLFGCVLLFGPQLAGKLSYPYTSFVSTITAGRLFTRLDGFAYIIYFASSLLKINLCFFVVNKSLKKINFILTK